MTDLARVLAEELDAKVLDLLPVRGGDICEAWRVELADGRRVFVKRPRSPRPGMLTAEARGLEWLAAAQALRIPAVVLALDGEADGGGFLAMEWVESVRPGPSFDEELGRGLAALHRSGADGFGLATDNFIGPLSQRNASRPTWWEFYGQQRLAPMLTAALDAGRLAPEFGRRAFARIERLGELSGPEEAPARLHGDLWGGNCIVDERGAPCLVDPAVYGGSREVDLAMMRLFGGFSQRVFDAYAEAHPLAPGHEGRVDLYQLYPLLVHLNLFGEGYREGVERAFERYL